MSQWQGEPHNGTYGPNDPVPPDSVVGNSPLNPNYRKPPKKRHTARNILLVIGALFALVIVAAVLSGGQQPASVEAPVSVTSKAGVPTSVPVETPTSEPTKAAPTEAPKPSATTKPSVKPAPLAYKKLTARAWAKIAKSPDSHIGETYVVYGEVIQFDSATGDDGFRANVDGVKHNPSYGYADYPTNTILSAVDSADLSDLVEGDLFQAKVMVMGSYSYDTQIGGNTTAPSLAVSWIKTIGSTK